MAAIVFPSTMPGPSIATITPSERRLLSDLPGPQQAAGIQRDYLATQQLQWSLLDATAAAAFQAWYQTTLSYGAAWFAATWPLPAGWVSGIRRFVGVPKWTYLAGGFWQVSATCEVRGRSKAPTDCFTETFTEFLPWPYGTVSGNPAIYSLVATPYGPGVAVAVETSATQSRQLRSIPPRNPLTSWTFKFQIIASNPDDAAVISLKQGSSTLLEFNPRVEAATDPTRAARFSVVQGGTTITTASPSGLTLNNWYQVSVVVAGGANNTICTLTDLVAQSVVQVTPVPIDFTPPLIDGLEFHTDSSLTSCSDVFADVHVC